MKPKLFESTAQTFNTNGMGILNDAAECRVREQRHAAIVNHNGFLFYNVVSSTSGLVRPVMWINIESDIYLP